MDTLILLFHRVYSQVPMKFKAYSDLTAHVCLWKYDIPVIAKGGEILTNRIPRHSLNILLALTQYTQRLTYIAVNFAQKDSLVYTRR